MRKRIIDKIPVWLIIAHNYKLRLHFSTMRGLQAYIMWIKYGANRSKPTIALHLHLCWCKQAVDTRSRTHAHSHVCVACTRVALSQVVAPARAQGLFVRLCARIYVKPVTHDSSSIECIWNRSTFSGTSPLVLNIKQLFGGYLCPASSGRVLAKMMVIIKQVN